MFTAGIGENDPEVRAGCAPASGARGRLDAERNTAWRRAGDLDDDSAVAVLVVPRHPRHRTLRHHRRAAGPRRGPGRRPLLPPRTPSWSVWPSPKCCPARLRAALAALRRPAAGPPVPAFANGSAYNRRLRRAAPLVALAIQDIAAHTPSWGDELRRRLSTRCRGASSRDNACWRGVGRLCRLWLLQRAITATSGASDSICWLPVMGRQWPGVCHPSSWASVRSWRPCWTTRAPAAPGPGHLGRQGLRLPRVRPVRRRPQARLVAA